MAVTPSRGEVHWVNLPKREDVDELTEGKEYGKRRPGIVIQNDAENSILDTTVVVPTTSGSSDDAKYLTWVFMASNRECVPEDSIAMCTQVRVVDNSRFDGKIGELSHSKFREVEKASQVALGFI